MLLVRLAAAGLLITSCSVTTSVTDWALTEQAGHQLTLVVLVGSSDCHTLDEVQVTETSATVEVVATVAESSGPLSCGRGDLNVQSVTVDLLEPLGDRQLVGCMLGEAEYFHPDTATPSSRRESCNEVIDW